MQHLTRQRIANQRRHQRHLTCAATATRSRRHALGYKDRSRGVRSRGFRRHGVPATAGAVAAAGHLLLRPLASLAAGTLLGAASGLVLVLLLVLLLAAMEPMAMAE